MKLRSLGYGSGSTSDKSALQRSALSAQCSKPVLGLLTIYDRESLDLLFSETLVAYGLVVLITALIIVDPSYRRDLVVYKVAVEVGRD